MKKIDNKKILKHFGIKQIPCEYTRTQCMDFYGFIPCGYADVANREIYVKNGTRKSVFIHEVCHVLMKHKNSVVYSKTFLLQEIETERLTRNICKKLDLKFNPANLQYYTKEAKKKKFKIKPRLRKMKQVFKQFLEAVET